MRALITSAAVLLSLATPAYASCVQEDFSGRWAGYIIISANDSAGSWVRCQLRISRLGAIRDITCRKSDGTSSALTKGQIRLANATRCTFKGRYKLGRVEHTIEHMTLAADKIAATGVGGTADGADFLVWQRHFGPGG